MLFPDVERVVYKKNPLIEVICQFRYPAILRIDAQKPVEFQELIRHEFPIYREKVSAGIPQEIAQLIPSEIAASVQQSNKSYEFSTQDGNWTISLTRDFIALTNTSYQRWEEFYAKLEIPFRALITIYSPVFFSRIGLRYQNAIQRSKLELQTVPWSELINPVVAGFLSSDVAPAVEDTTQIALLKFDDMASKVRIRHGLVKHNENKEICYLLDNDFFVDEDKDIQDGLDITTELNRRNRNLFRWCITDKLHRAMEPASRQG